MRLAFATGLALCLLAAPALAQSPAAGAFNAMSPEQAARLNAAAAQDPKAREALDAAERELKKAGHKAGEILEKTRQ